MTTTDPAALAALLREAAQHLEPVQDVGPEGEGWKSDDLQSCIGRLYAAAAALERPEGRTPDAESVRKIVRAAVGKHLVSFAGHSLVDPVREGRIADEICAALAATPRSGDTPTREPHA